MLHCTKIKSDDDELDRMQWLAGKTPQITPAPVLIKEGGTTVLKQQNKQRQRIFPPITHETIQLVTLSFQWKRSNVEQAKDM
mmetsp:Transcript_349/g.969  ORF Transcript_349/g.969 Transcript_349/m.969 type:complete len:82 (-) Transcript_349:474-719(-)